jgi:hypothetical protein
VATIHPINPQQPEQEQQQEPQGFQIRIDAEVQPDLTVIRMQTGPFDVRLQPVPNDIMQQIVAMWLLQHPSEAIEIMKDVKQKIKPQSDLIYTQDAKR